jgi:hypothetical protein
LGLASGLALAVRLPDALAGGKADVDNARRSGLVAVVLLVWRGIRVVAAGPVAAGGGAAVRGSS